jgi:sugar (pentulose or hexulose) kinase
MGPKLQKPLSDANLMAVIDIGKTRSKLAILTPEGRLEFQTASTITPRSDGPYPHLDSAAVWQWLLQSFCDSHLGSVVQKCIVSTHGAAFALLDYDGLATPVMDYEFDGFAAINADYDLARDDFEYSYSPALAAGLNAGRQVFFVQQTMPSSFEKVTAIVPYPQFWAARLCGVVATEATSLGSHTDLWRPATRSYSRLVMKQNWLSRMPSLRSAWTDLGPILPHVAAAARLNSQCRVHCGLHDSNASYLRHLGEEHSRVCVVSTGTWVVCMAGGHALEDLDPGRDMLANVDVFANPIPCARFMAGREYEHLTAGTADCENPDPKMAEVVMSNDAMALPSFIESGGPFSGCTGQIINAPSESTQTKAMASLYCALVTDVCLDNLGASGELIIEGRYVRDAVYIEALTHFRQQQRVRISDDETGTVRGAARLLNWPSEKPGLPPRYEAAGPATPYVRYRARWRERLDR